MKKLMMSLCCLALLATACNSEKKDATSDGAKVDTTTTSQVDTAAMNKAWAAYMTPGDTHKMMAAADGKWNAEITMYYSSDQPPSVNKAVCENKMILGGRYQQSTYKGSFEGMPFEGINTLAYDNSKKIYVSTWVDNMGTGVMYLEGTFDVATKTMNMKGKATDVVSGKDITIRETMKFIDDNTQQMEMFDTKDGKEVKTMSISLKRAK
ncbi:DUF1579 domain-containing protein [Pedobacter sp. LMG 31464]|uniref:DUF1579 domain-containing protein n=1 Tax=Pedobacter planticolens TaxID=2679964 RepID=A0A923DYI0_9SPHI|nr:DUF1579 domain-containing protein [Pedobacter planticolens]MBB2146391.1 DUF1579 domain-containing protein [Pedobacter planticolens]